MEIEELAFQLHDYGFNIITWKLDKDHKHPYFPANKCKYEWMKFKGNRLTIEQLKANIERLKAKGLPVRIGFIPDKITDGKYKGKYTWGIDFDKVEHSKTLESRIKACKKDGTYWEKSLSKGSHLIGISNTPLSESSFQLAEKNKDLDFQVFSVVENNNACRFLAIYGNFEHKFHDLKPYNLDKGISDIIQKLSAWEINTNKEPDCIKLIETGKDIKKGSRHNHRIAYASYLQQEGLNCDEIRSKILKWNDELEEPEPDTNAILNDVGDICKGEHKFGCSSLKTLGKCPYVDDISKCKWLARRNKNPLYTCGAVFDRKNGSKAINTGRLAQYLLNIKGFKIKTLIDRINKSEELVIYNEKTGFYEPADSLIRAKITELIPDLSTTKVRNEVVDYLKTINHVYRDEFIEKPHLLNVKNGVLNIYTGERKDHSTEYNFLNMLPVVYDKKAECPKFKKFLSQVLYPHQIKLVQEMIGYFLLRGYPFHVAFILYGGGRNGKNVLVNTIIAMLGSNNCTSMTFEEITTRDNYRYNLIGKMVNFDTELSTNEIMDASNFKKLFGDWITGRDLYKKPVNFRNYSKLVFNTNRLPPTKDTTIAFYNRWIIIVFPNTFIRGDSKTNPHLEEELKEELSGILNWSIEGLKRLLKNNDFSYKDDMENPLYEQLRTPECEFFNYFEVKGGNEEYKNEVYKIYEAWARMKQYPVEYIGTFTKRLKEYYKEVDPTTKGKGKNRVAIYKNIKFDRKTFEKDNPKLKKVKPQGNQTNLDGDNQ